MYSDNEMKIFLNAVDGILVKGFEPNFISFISVTFKDFTC